MGPIGHLQHFASNSHKKIRTHVCIRVGSKGRIRDVTCGPGWAPAYCTGSGSSDVVLLCVEDFGTELS